MNDDGYEYCAVCGGLLALDGVCENDDCEEAEECTPTTTTR